MRACTINVRGLRDRVKRSAIIFWLTQQNFDLICLQETHSTSDEELSSWFARSIFKAYGTHGSARSAGCALLFKKSSTSTVITHYADDSGRFTYLKFNIPNSSVLTVAGLYAPNHNPAKDNFFGSLTSLLDPREDIILLGDFNSAPDPPLDRTNAGALHPSYDSSAKLQELLDWCQVVDAWRFLHPTKRGFTCRNSDGINHSRIDLVCLPRRFLPSVTLADIKPFPHSDHAAVAVSFTLPSPRVRGPGYWKLNTSLLVDENYTAIVENFWKSWRASKPRFRSILSWWDVGKRKVKEITIKFASEKRKLARVHRTSLESSLAILKSRLDSGDTSCHVEYLGLLEELKLLDAVDARSAEVRSRAQWIEHGEQSTSFFLGLKDRHSLRTILRPCRPLMALSLMSRKMSLRSGPDFIRHSLQLMKWTKTSNTTSFSA